MKIGLYVEDGLEHVVLTPTSEAEKDILGKLHQHGRAYEIHRGDLYSHAAGRRLPLTSDSSVIVLRAIGGVEAPPCSQVSPPATGDERRAELARLPAASAP